MIGRGEKVCLATYCSEEKSRLPRNNACPWQVPRAHGRYCRPGDFLEPLPVQAEVLSTIIREITVQTNGSFWKSGVRAERKMVGVTGFEPATSWSQTTRATNCATPRCEKPKKKEGVGWLTGIEPAYAGITIRCVNHFATATITDTNIEA